MADLFENITARLETPSKVVFSCGVTMEFFGSRVLISDVIRNRSVEIICRFTEEFYDKDRAPLFRDIYWEIDPVWSDGTRITDDEVLSLAALVKQASVVAKKKVRQVFEDEEIAMRVGDSDEFNTI